MAETPTTGAPARGRAPFVRAEGRISALARVYVPGDHGARTTPTPGVTLRERHPLSIVQVETRPNAWAATRNALARRLGTEPLPGPGSAVGDGRPRVLWAGPNRCWVVEPESRPLAAELADAYKKSAVVDLGHARTVIRLSGPGARRVLAKGTAVDVHPNAFGTGQVAMTALFHAAATIDCRDGDPTQPVYDLYVARGYAVSFWEMLTDAAAEVGYRVA